MSSRLLYSPIIVASLLSLAAGAIGGAFAALWIVPSITVSEPFPPPRMRTLASGTNVPHTLANAAAPAVFLLIPKTAVRSFGLASFPFPEAAAGRATALTTDGWIVFDAAESGAGLLALGSDGRATALGSQIKDPATGLSFTQLPLGELPSLALATAPLRTGDSLFIVLGRNTIIQASVVHPHEPVSPRLEDAAASSEVMSTRASLSVPLGKSARGAPAFDESGTLVGIMVGEHGDRVLPIEQVRRMLPELFKTRAVHRPYLGVRAVDVSRLTRADGFPLRRGALLADFSRRSPVIPGSPAAAAGLKNGDIILEIEKEIIAPGETVAAKLAAYVPGERVSLVVRRGDATLTLTAVLGDTREVR